MATINAQLSLVSTDLLTDSLSVVTSANLRKAESSSGLDQVRMGRNEIPTGTSFDLLDATTAAIDKANKVYISNLSTDESYFIIVVIDAKVIGRLYAGDWMFIPWNASDNDAEIEIQAQGGTNIIEYCLFNSDVILPTAG